MKTNNYLKHWVISLMLVCSSIITVAQTPTTNLISHQPTTSPPTGATFEWHTGIAPTSALVSTPNAVAPGLYYGFYNYGAGCFSEPSPIKVITNTCPTTTVDLNVATNTPPVGATLSFHNALPVSDANAISGNAITAAGVGTYYVAYKTVVNGASCYSNPSPIVVVITVCCPIFQANGATVCVGNAINLSATGTGSYTWVGPNSFSSSQQSPSITNASAAMAGVYTVTLSGISGCTATASVVVNANPNALAANDSPSCAGKTLNLNASGGATYSWAGPNNFSSSQQNPSISSVGTANQGVYTVVVTNANACTATATTQVTVNPAATASAVNLTGCAGKTLFLAVESNGSSFSWVGPNGFTSTLQYPTIPNLKPTDSGNYIATVDNGQGCTASIAIVVVVNPNPTAGATGSTICQGLTAILKSGGGTTYTWGGVFSFTSTNQNPTIPNAGFVHSGSYTVTVSNSFGCTSTATAGILVVPLPTISVIQATVGCLIQPKTEKKLQKRNFILPYQEYDAIAKLHLPNTNCFLILNFFYRFNYVKFIYSTNIDDIKVIPFTLFVSPNNKLNISPHKKMNSC